MSDDRITWKQFIDAAIKAGVKDDDYIGYIDICYPIYGSPEFYISEGDTDDKSRKVCVE